MNSILGDGFKYENFVNNPVLESPKTPIFSNYTDDVEGEALQVPDEDTYDQYVGAEVTLAIGNKLLSAKV